MVEIKKLFFYALLVTITFFGLISARYLEMLVLLGIVLMLYYINLNFKKFFVGSISKNFTRNYIFNSERDILTYEADGKFISACAIECFLSETGLDGKTLEKFMNSVDYPFKIQLYANEVDISNYVDWLKEERSRYEYKKSRLEDENKTLNMPEIVQIERKISTINNLLEKIVKGDKPYEFRYIIIVHAIGNDYIESINQANVRISTMQKIANALFAGNTKRIKGYELYELWF